MATRKEQLISLILAADDQVIDAVLTILQTQVSPLNLPDNDSDISLFRESPIKHSNTNYTDCTQEFNDEIKNIFGF